MTKCNWVVENFSDGDDIFFLIQAIKDAGHPLIQITRKTGFESNHVKFDNECVVFYGSINMAALMQKHLVNCTPVVWDTDKFECTNYWPHFKDLLFNDKYEFTTLSNLKEKKFEFYTKYGKDSMIFVRPSCGIKTFTGQLLDLQDFDHFFEASSRCMAVDTDIVVVSTPKNIVAEFRFIVTDEKTIISKSCYKFHKKIISIPGAPDKAVECAKKVLDVGFYPGRVFSLDVAQDEDGNFWLMEFNSVNSCGLYATDKRAIVDEMTRLAIVDFETKHKPVMS